MTPEQLEERRKGIGGSEIGAVLGLSPFAGPLDVYLSKVEGLDAQANADMERGTFLEDGVARWYSHREGLVLYEPGPILHRHRAFARCTPDRLGSLEGRDRLVSIKCPRRAGDRWGETGGHVVPETAVLQLQWEDACLSSRGIGVDPTFHLVALLEGELRVYPVERDVELQGWLLDEAGAWWERHVVARVPPPLDGSETAREWLRRRFPAATQPSRPATLGEDLLMVDLQAAEAARDAAERTYQTARQLVEERIGEAGGIYGPAGAVTWRTNKLGRRTFKTQWKGTP